MRNIRISDITLVQADSLQEYSLSFKDRIDIAIQLDRLQLDEIDINRISNPKIDALMIKSMASSLKYARLGLPVSVDDPYLETALDLARQFDNIRLQVAVPVSSVGMEYLLHIKADALKSKVEETIRSCREITSDVEFVAIDASRCEPQYLSSIAAIAIAAGATTVTVCDTAGILLPMDLERFIGDLTESVPELKEITLGIECADKLSLATASCMTGILYGVGEIKAAAHPVDCAALSAISAVLEAKGESFGLHTNLRTVALHKGINKINSICESVRSKTSPFDNGVKEQDAEDISLTAEDDKETLLRAVAALGYELTNEDVEAVWEAFQRNVGKKGKLQREELDAIVANSAMQVPATFELDTFVINLGNKITSMAHIVLKKNGKPCEGMALGDGPIDAAFLALERITGHHYVLDDFQIRAVTEGHEAMGETIVKLQSNGKIYPGRGISTDIVGSSVRAYINALNRIYYEEAVE